MTQLKAKVALAGVGNCASVFVQGLRHYSMKKDEGLWHPSVGGLAPKDIEVVAAFDVDPRKAGKDLSKAILAAPNVARRYCEVPRTGLEVFPGLSVGSVAPHLSGSKLALSGSKTVSEALSSAGAEILVNMISSGSDASTRAYALAALDAGCSFVNCAPSLLQTDSDLQRRYSEAEVALVGDDLMSQFGGTAFHKGLLGMMVNRGVRVGKSYQLDVGGGSETFNTVEEKIKLAKRDIKTASVASEVPYEFETIAGTTDYVDYMGNERTSYFWSEGTGFMGSEFTVDVYLRTSDGANAGNILFDVIRATHSAVASGDLAKVEAISEYGFKSPRRSVHLERAYEKFSASFVD